VVGWPPCRTIDPSPTRGMAGAGVTRACHAVLSVRATTPLVGAVRGSVVTSE
jgi:hypothetical protein